LEKHQGAQTIAHVEDLAGHAFTTLANNLFVIGEGNKTWISLPKGNGIKKSIIEQRKDKSSASTTTVQNS